MNIDQIIGKLMGDGSVGEEKTALDAWKKEAEDNMKALEDINKIASLSNTLNGYEDFNADSAWDSFSANLDSENVTSETPQHKASIFSIKNITRIAAILVVVVGSLFVLNQYASPASTGFEEKTYTAALETMDIDLRDETNVTLDTKSDLKVLDERSVSLVGRAHFDVTSDETKQFSIDLPVGKVVVLGTEFTIDANDKTTEIYVIEGRVRYELDEQRTWILEAGDLVKVRNNDASFSKGNDNTASWKNQRLIFRDNNMEEVVSALSKHFKKDIQIENEKDFSKCNVMNTFTNASLEEILNELTKIYGLRFEYRGNKLFIVSAKC